MITCWLGLERKEDEEEEQLSELLTDMFMSMSNISGFNRLILLLLLLAKTLFSWQCNADSVLFITYMARLLMVIQDGIKKSTRHQNKEIHEKFLVEICRV